MRSKLFLRLVTLLQKKSLQGEFLQEFSFRLSAAFNTDKDAGVVFDALFPEMGGKHEKRSKTTLSKQGNVVFLKVSAMDKKALRASINSYLKLLDLSIQSLEVI